MLGRVIWSSVSAPLPLALASWFFEGGTAAWDAVVRMDWKTWACVLFMSYFATLFGLPRWNALLHRYPPAVIAPFAITVPASPPSKRCSRSTSLPVQAQPIPTS